MVYVVEDFDFQPDQDFWTFYFYSFPSFLHYVPVF